eukprot:2650967-Rhodomonas_salina.2
MECEWSANSARIARRTWGGGGGNLAASTERLFTVLAQRIDVPLHLRGHRLGRHNVLPVAGQPTTSAFDIAHS